MNNFYVEIRIYIESKVDKLSTFTYKTYLAHLNKLRIYQPQMDCSEITEKFVFGYIDFMRSRGNSSGTIYRSLSILRMFVKALVRKRKIRRDPMRNIPIKRTRCRREFLELDELEWLYSNFQTHAFELNFSEREALRAFLFSCFTGLRYSDLKNLTSRDMQNGKIRLFTQKTDALIYIPVPAQALKLVCNTSFCGSVFANDSGKILHVVNNSTFNKNLRSGAKKLGCCRHLHAHLARHTFATSCVTFGMPVEIIAKMLGHTDIQTTLIYANYSNAVIDREMQKFQIDATTNISK